MKRQQSHSKNSVQGMEERGEHNKDGERMMRGEEEERGKDQLETTDAFQQAQHHTEMTQEEIDAKWDAFCEIHDEKLLSPDEAEQVIKEYEADTKKPLEVWNYNLVSAVIASAPICVPHSPPSTNQPR